MLRSAFLLYLVLRTAHIFLLDLPPEVEPLFNDKAAEFLCWFALYWVLSTLSRVESALPWICVLNAMLTLLDVSGVHLIYPTDPAARGLIGNPSMNGTFQAVMLPLCMSLGTLPTIVVLLSILLPAVMGSGTSIPIGLLAVSGAVLLSHRYGRKGVILSAIFVTFCAVLGCLFVPEFLSSSGRFARWEEIFGAWPGDPVFGMGGGSFSIVGVWIQRAAGHTDWEMTFLHSDWAQLYLEFGLVGLALGILAFRECLSEYRHHPRHLATAFTLGVAGLFNWPAHCFLTTLLGLILVRGRSRTRYLSPRT